MDIILIHGMGRTPFSMLVLSHRLRIAGFRTRLFGYSPTFETYARCASRLASQIRSLAGKEPYALIGHSLGTVLIRAVLPGLEAAPPSACFFLAPPSRACKAAKYFAGNPLYRLLMGEMGQLLADEAFMDSLPMPPANTWIYAGTAGPKGSFPFNGEPNDGILTVAETKGTLKQPLVLVPSSHTFIMNSRKIAEEIANTLSELEDTLKAEAGETAG